MYPRRTQWTLSLLVTLCEGAIAAHVRGEERRSKGGGRAQTVSGVSDETEANSCDWRGDEHPFEYLPKSLLQAMKDQELLETFFSTIHHFFPKFVRDLGKFLDPRHPSFITYPLPILLLED